MTHKQPTVAGRKGITANFGERERPWTKVAPFTNEFTDPVLYTPTFNGARTTDSTPDFQRTHRNRERLRAGATSLLLLRVVLQITSWLFTTCRSRAEHGAGMSAPFLIYTFHRLRGKRRVSAALREMTCYLMLRAAPTTLRCLNGDAP